jgi:hypothetical protein
MDREISTHDGINLEISKRRLEKELMKTREEWKKK